MSDRLSIEQRHKTMSAIRSKDTKPEMIVRKYLWNNGFRYRLNHPRLPGKPDIVLRRYRTCIFINGCFWHGHEECRFFVMPKSRTDFWESKIRRNQERDKNVQQKLVEMGWRCVTIWECQLKPSNKAQTLESLTYTLSKNYLQDHQPRKYEIPEEENLMMVAEE